MFQDFNNNPRLKGNFFLSLFKGVFTRPVKEQAHFFLDLLLAFLVVAAIIILFLFRGSVLGIGIIFVFLVIVNRLVRSGLDFSIEQIFQQIQEAAEFTKGDFDSNEVITET